MGVGVEHRLTLAGSGVELQLELTVCEGLGNFPNQGKQALQDHLIFQFTDVFGVLSGNHQNVNWSLRIHVPESHSILV
jgi:hypothetical protein